MRLARARDSLFAPVDVAWLVALRIGLGTLLFWHVASYLGRGLVRRYWIEPAFRFEYPGFGWVVPWPGEGMLVHFWILGFLALLIAAGFLYRVAAALFFLGFAQVFLLEQARYQNHAYLILLLAFLAIFLPAQRAFSVDRRLRPACGADAVPAWTLLLVRFQVGVPYFFGGVAKLNGDWLRGEPLREWLAAKTDFPFLGAHFHREWAIHAFGYAGLLLDLLAVPLLCWRRTRTAAFALLFLFHCSNARLFTIGIFPWLMIVLTTVFLEPDWPRRLVGALREGPAMRTAAVLGGALFAAAFAFFMAPSAGPAALLAGAVAGAILGERLSGRAPVRGVGAAPALAGQPQRRRLVLASLGIWCLAQVLVPLRHFLIPGKVAWTAEGQDFAWHMKLNDTDGRVLFRVLDLASGRTSVVDPRQRLTPWQCARMESRPLLIRQYARHLADEAGDQGRQVEVRVDAWLSLNDRPMQRLIAPEVDLARVPGPGLGPADWVVPLQVGGR